MPLDGDEEHEAHQEGQGPQGFAGERSEDRGLAKPELRRSVETGDRTVVVEEASGTAFAEATGASDREPPDPPADGGVDDAAFPVNATPRE